MSIRQKIIYSYIGNDRFVSYTFDNVPTVHTEFQSPSADLAKKYQFAIKELELINSYLGEICGAQTLDIGSFSGNPESENIKLEQRNAIINQGLFSAATIAYGKIFGGVGEGRRQFMPKDFFTKGGEKFKELHTWWMDIRHDYIAHSNGGQYDDARVVLLFTPPYIDNPNFLWCFPHVRFNRIPPLDTIADLRQMTEFMFSIMLVKQEALMKHIAKSIGPIARDVFKQKAVSESICIEMPPAPKITV